MTAPLRLRLLACILLSLAAAAQPPSKRPLTHKDYDSWRSITNQVLSNDGATLAYALFPQDGDGQLVVRNLRTGGETQNALGALPPPPEPNAESPEESEPRPAGVRIAFTADGRFVVATTFPLKADTSRAKKERKRPDQMPKGGLLIVPVDGAAAVRVADVKSMQVPEKGASLVVYLKEAAPAAAAAGEAKPAGDDEDQARRAAAGAGGGARARYGSDLVLRDLATAGERVFADVTEFALSKDGATLAYAVASRKAETNGVYAVTPGSDAAPVALASGAGTYARPTFDRLNTRLAFLGAPKDGDAKQAPFRLYLWDRKAPEATAVVTPATSGFRDGYGLFDRAPLSFSYDGSRVFVGVASAATRARNAEPAAEPAPVNDDKAVADLWHWKDDYVQPIQKARLAQERNRSYRAVYHIAEKRFLQLADPTMTAVTPSDDGRWSIGTDDRRYRAMSDFDSSYSDYYLVDNSTGDRKLLLEKVRGGGPGGGAMSWSPDGKYVLYFRDRQWHTLSIPAGTDTNLTARLGVNVYNEEHDTPGPAAGYGNAGWTRDGRVLIYDRFDVWATAPDGRARSNVTGGTGRKQNVQFRVVRLDRPAGEEEERGVDPAKPLFLRGENLETRESGVWGATLDRESEPQRLIGGAKNYRPLLKAKDADVVLLTATTFSDEPDLLTTDSAFSHPKPATNMNPQKAGILWGSAELVSYKTTDGIGLKAALYKPENFDPKRKYPLIVYIYERLTQVVHNYSAPRPGTSINIPYYVSNGYLVLTPDIAYTIGEPGPSALKCVLPAVDAVVARGFVDENAIGIQGHSWGGYQIAYMITQTTRFRAAEAGAPVANMISAYNGIRWGTGLPRQFQYEQTQSRIGGTPWQYPLRFIENSPVFHVDRVKTPLLILHDDGDDAVPWYQGIEMFLSLRRLGKEAYLFNYNGEPHGLRKRPNQKDYTVRMQQFFDHFLKGAPAPEWMEKGIPYLDRETEKDAFAAAQK
jgi:dipeptidyl aminopeptidase/acylaminoacyl peptidase